MEGVKRLSERVRPNSEAAPWVIEEIRRLEMKLDAIVPVSWWIHGPSGATALVFKREDIEPRIAELAKQYNHDPDDFTATTFYADRSQQP